MSERIQLRDDQRIIVTAAVSTAPASWEDFRDGRHGIKPVEEIPFVDANQFDPNGPRVFGVTKYMPEEDPLVTEVLKKPLSRKFLHRSAYLTWHTLDQAIKSAGLEDFDSYRMGLLIGSTFGGTTHIAETDLDKVGPSDVMQNLMARVATAAAKQTNIRNIVAQVGSECASAGTATQLAAAMLYKLRPDMKPMVDAMFVGGSDAPVEPKNVKYFASGTKAATKESNPDIASNPLDKSAAGLVVAEGCGLLVLETWEGAQRRGLTENDVLAELAGFASFTHAESNTLAGLEGGAKVIEFALRMAGVEPGEKILSLMHATSTPTGTPEEPGGDRREINAHRLAAGALGLSISDIYLSRPKANTGHTMGAAPGIEAVYSVHALREQVMPVALNLSDPVEETDGFNLGSPTEALPLPGLDVVLSPAYGFTGTGNALVWRKFRA